MTGRVDERRRSLATGATRDPNSRVERALRTAAEDAALKRSAFRARWCALAATSAPDEPELMIKIGVLFERLGEIVGDLEAADGGTAAADAMIAALEALDALDERLGDIERWVRDVAARQGVSLPTIGAAVRS